MIEALAALGLSGAVIAACLFLAGESSGQVAKRIQRSKGYLALQNLSEQLLVSNGSNTYLDAGAHGPIYFDSNGRLAGAGPVSVSWFVTLNDPSPNIIKVKTDATWGEGGSQNANLVIYRSAPLRSSTTIVATVVC